MARVELAEIVAAFQGAESFLIASHPSPDGDAIGTALALGCFLRALGKEHVVCVNDDPVPRRYQWVPGVESIMTHEQVTGSFDAVVMIDVHGRDRIGRSAKLISPAAQAIVVDHHQSPAEPGALAFVDPSYCAVGEIVAEMFHVADVSLTRQAAEYIYIAMATDTGGFQYANTTPRCHRTVAALLETGLDVAGLSDRLFGGLSVPKFELLRRVVARMEREADGRLAHTFLRMEDMREGGADAEDCDGLVNYCRDIEGVEAGFLFRELEEGKTKVSMRSRAPVDCARFLKAFGGGGHAGAGGVTLDMPVVEAQDAILKRARELCNGHNPEPKNNEA
ncbi:MAG: hypothetical protein GWP08_02215 [Nitrospiraceae bacterium]|nr:hypothetical protein [Nitrospiraceae bacterium]